MKEMRDKQRRKIIKEINNYLMKMENDGDGDARVLHLLSATKETLKEGEREGEKREREEINPIQSALKNI